MGAMRRFLGLLVLCAAACGDVVDNTGEVTITPSEPRTADDLTAVTMVNGPTLRWSKNGSVRDDLLSTRVDNALTTKGDTWTVELVDAGGNAIATDEVTILNTAPDLPAVTLSPEMPVSVGQTQCLVPTLPMDVDQDTVTLSATWTKNGEPVTTTTMTTFPGDTVPGGTFAADDAVECTVTATDGTDDAITTKAATAISCVTGGTMSFVANGTPPNGTLQMFTVPAGVCLVTIEAGGAEGGETSVVGATRGARMKGTFSVQPGSMLKILVGQQAGLSGANQRLSGGGGSFVTTMTNTPLIVAGGGGSRFLSTPLMDETVGRITTSGGTLGGAPRADNGSGGMIIAGSNSGAGGGLLTSGAGVGGGQGFVQGGLGGNPPATTTDQVKGGYGGGGGRSGSFGEGAGGGYSGGSCGDTASSWVGCGGGGSFNSGTAQQNTAGAVTGNGYVTITW